MARCYSVPVPNRHPSIPDIWLVSDARNDAALEKTLARLPYGSGVIFRHYHLKGRERTARFAAFRRLAARRGHCMVLSGTAREARRLKADGAYASAGNLARGPATLRLVTVHSLRELAMAHRARADAVLLSPVFPTRSHPGAAALGPVRFHLIARHARVPVIALGGMSRHRAHVLRARKWAAIDAFSG